MTQETCPLCKGNGFISDDEPDKPFLDRVVNVWTCVQCKGSGKVTEES